ncbi:serine/threonine-protein kinase [Hyalangium rubrum]|uniref:Serine/threonine-protein kinase n=1 Tax=Hyalangium rubrum TaxID=3103134 RepID=A0ABU5HFD6_9BACT|nr:serine/threonine-protein kinase [Hyalangium sp. s54d21]MDY7232189.1 serine/threonine-protein kinase [Hyalangium sp. s54d21]
MATPTRTSAVSKFLSNHLRRDAQARETSVAGYMAGLAAACLVAVGALGPYIGWGLTRSLLGLVAVLCLYYTVLWRALRAGWFHPAIHWLNVAIEVSIPSVVLAFDLRFQGPTYALTAPTLVIWGTLVVLAALRTNPKLALMAGALAGGEYLALYFLFVRPLLPEQPLLTLTPPFIIMRSVFLLSSGVATAILARHFMRKTAQALAALREQEVMGKYMLHERIGVGGMAEVFRATYSPEGGFEKQVALKRVLPGFADDIEFVTLFRREAELCSMLHHPNIIQVFDLGRHGNTYFLAMEYVDGLPLSSLLRGLGWQGLPLSAATFLGAELASALDYLHRRTTATGEPLHLVHRDMNPPNVLVSRIGEVKLSDFGIARSASRAQLTMAGNVRGKLGYMAPEQAMAQSIDGRTDLFALGLTLHEALTGRRVLTGENEAQLLMAAVEQPIPPPSHLRPEIPPELDAVVMRLLERDVNKRTPTGAEARAQLLALTGAVAPFPQGQLELTRAAQQALTRVRPSSERVSGAHPLTDDPTQLEARSG